MNTENKEISRVLGYLEYIEEYLEYLDSKYIRNEKNISDRFKKFHLKAIFSIQDDKFNFDLLNIENQQ